MYRILEHELRSEAELRVLSIAQPISGEKTLLFAQSAGNSSYMASLHDHPEIRQYRGSRNGNSLAADLDIVPERLTCRP